ncbi:MAG: cyclic-di-AMP receptor, partial [Armatimonadetes bacterium]|nr:cyclic-di-AMP receptor [Armatimonadota bacterium]
MKLVIAVVHDRDKNKISDTLLRNGFKFTKVASTGGFLREGNVTLFIGVEDEDLEQVLRLI